MNLGLDMNLGSSFMYGMGLTLDDIEEAVVNESIGDTEPLENVKSDNGIKVISMTSSRATTKNIGNTKVKSRRTDEEILKDYSLTNIDTGNIKDVVIDNGILPDDIDLDISDLMDGTFEKNAIAQQFEDETTDIFEDDEDSGIFDDNEGDGIFEDNSDEEDIFGDEEGESLEELTIEQDNQFSVQSEENSDFEDTELGSDYDTDDFDDEDDVFGDEDDSFEDTEDYDNNSFEAEGDADPEYLESSDFEDEDIEEDEDIFGEDEDDMFEDEEEPEEEPEEPEEEPINADRAVKAETAPVPQPRQEIFKSVQTNEKFKQQDKEIAALREQLAELQANQNKISNSDTSKQALEGEGSIKNDIVAKNVSQKAASGQSKQHSTEIFNTMTEEKLFELVKKFMRLKGLDKSTVDINLLHRQFGEYNIKRLIRKNFLIKVGKGVTTGR